VGTEGNGHDENKSACSIMAVLFLCAPLLAFSAGKARPTWAYLQKLEDLRRERVIVVFWKHHDPTCWAPTTQD
jgi:hypothetical protein